MPQLTEKQERQLWLDRALVARSDPWYFFKYFVSTKDERDPSVLAKPFPRKAMYRVLCRVASECNILFTEKTRQIMMTWFYAGYLLHDGMFKKNRRIADQSKKQEDADGILERQRHIYKNLLKFSPLFEQTGGFPYADMVGEKVGKSSELNFKTPQSVVLAIPQGADILPSHTWSIVFADEINLQPEAESGFNAALPAAQQYFGVGTPYGKKFAYWEMYNYDTNTLKKVGKNKCDSNDVKAPPYLPPDDVIENDPDFPEEARRRWIEDRIVNLPDDEFAEIPLLDLIACMPGMRLWQNYKGYWCLRVHYSADPDKDPKTRAGKAWKDVERAKYSLGYWEQHYEISYEAFEGRAVISNWDRDIFVKEKEYDSEYPIRLSFDFGVYLCGTPIAQYRPIEGFNARQLVILDELILRHSNTPEMAVAIVEHLEHQYRRSWENNNLLPYADPAGNQSHETTSDKSLMTSIAILEQHGIYCDSRKFGVPETTELLETVFALTLPNGEPAVVIHPRCEYLISVLGGGLHYPKDKGRPGYYEKDNEFDHGGDMIRILVANCFDEYDLAQRRWGKDKEVNRAPQRVFDARTGTYRNKTRVRLSRGRHYVHSSR